MTAGSDLAVVFGEDDVADLVQPVVSVPVSRAVFWDLVGLDVGSAQVGDRVGGLGAPSAAVSAQRVGDLDRLVGVREL